MLVLEWKQIAFIEKVNSKCFCWFPAAILVDQNGTPIWRLHTKLYKGAWNVSANNSETVGHKDLKLGQIVYVVVFYNFIFLCLFHWTVSNFLLLRFSVLTACEMKREPLFSRSLTLVPRSFLLNRTETLATQTNARAFSLTSFETQNSSCDFIRVSGRLICLLDLDN